MKHFVSQDLTALGKLERTNLINSISGFKPANLIGTISRTGIANLAIFTSIVHVGANPPLLGLIMRPVGEVPRHTYENIKETGVYTINHVHESFVERAHRTSAKFERGVSEFAACGFSAEFVADFAAPFVGESRIKIGLELVEEILINANQTIFIIGEIKHLIVPDDALLKNGNVDLNAVGDVCVTGLETYHKAQQIKTFSVQG